MDGLGTWTASEHGRPRNSLGTCELQRGCNTEPVPTGPSGPDPSLTIGSSSDGGRHAILMSVRPTVGCLRSPDAMRVAKSAQDPRARLTTVLRAGLLAVAALAILPLPGAFAAEPTPTPVTDPDHHNDPTPEPTATPTPEPTPEPTATPGPYAINLYRSSTVVRQYKSTWCVPAATQSMWNLIGRISNTSYSRQKALYSQIRAPQPVSLQDQGQRRPGLGLGAPQVHGHALPVGRVHVEDGRDQGHRQLDRRHPASGRDHRPSRDPCLGRARLQVERPTTGRSSGSTSTDRLDHAPTIPGSTGTCRWRRSARSMATTTSGRARSSGNTSTSWSPIDRPAADRGDLTAATRPRRRPPRPDPGPDPDRRMDGACTASSWPVVVGRGSTR